MGVVSSPIQFSAACHLMQSADQLRPGQLSTSSKSTPQCNGMGIRLDALIVTKWGQPYEIVQVDGCTAL